MRRCVDTERGSTRRQSPRTEPCSRAEPATETIRRGASQAASPRDVARAQGSRSPPSPSPPMGRLLASSGGDQTIRLWHLPSGASVRPSGAREARSAPSSSLPMGACSRVRASDNTVRLWHVSNGASVATLRGHADWVESLAVTPDGACSRAGPGTGPSVSGAPRSALTAAPSRPSSRRAPPPLVQLHPRPRCPSAPGSTSSSRSSNVTAVSTSRSRSRDTSRPASSTSRSGAEVGRGPDDSREPPKQLADTTPLLGERRRRRAAERLAELARNRRRRRPSRPSPRQSRAAPTTVQTLS